MTDHAHDGFELPLSEVTDGGADTALLGQLVGAAFDECLSCQEAMLTLIAEDVPTTAQLVELALVAVHNTLGALPVDLVDTGDTDSPVPVGFRQMALTGLDGDTAALDAACAGLSAPQRLAAARTATDLFVGEMRATGPE
ncbi:hypothetical protein [Nocardia altamirensis]|uniref:hypothetical protein n=1 Tax=Nocardia altamirensis TaxID=472158 RepID=UPI0008400A55|nr:hypothetical protein [Nocardia altamirensis]